jgi:hypothetical protein
VDPALHRAKVAQEEYIICSIYSDTPKRNNFRMSVEVVGNGVFESSVLKCPKV